MLGAVHVTPFEHSAVGSLLINYNVQLRKPKI